MGVIRQRAEDSADYEEAVEATEAVEVEEAPAVEEVAAEASEEVADATSTEESVESQHLATTVADIDAFLASIG